MRIEGAKRRNCAFAGANTPWRRIHVLSAISLFIRIESSTGVQAGDPAGPNEADRLFALARSHWAESTSAYVEQLLQRALALREALS
jgi:hypothetical protein